MSCSICRASRMLITLTSTPIESATDWITANWPIPAAMAEPKNRYSRDGWGNLLEQLRPFRGQCIVKCNKASCVATRSSQAVDLPAPNWINDTVEYDRHRVCHSKQHFQPELAGHHDNVRWKCDQFFRVFASLRRITARPSDFNPHIVAVDPAQLMQDFQE